VLRHKSSIITIEETFEPPYQSHVKHDYDRRINKVQKHIKETHFNLKPCQTYINLT
jgi:hypothetical protein